MHVHLTYCFGDFGALVSDREKLLANRARQDIFLKKLHIAVLVHLVKTVQRDDGIIAVNNCAQANWARVCHFNALMRFKHCL